MVGEEGGSSGSSKRMPGDLCVIAVCKIGLYAPCPSSQISYRVSCGCNVFSWLCCRRDAHLLENNLHKQGVFICYSQRSLTRISSRWCQVFVMAILIYFSLSFFLSFFFLPRWRMFMLLFLAQVTEVKINLIAYPLCVAFKNRSCSSAFHVRDT